MRAHVPGRPLAIVLGTRGIEVVRALAMASAPCGVVTAPGDPARWSRHTRNVLDWDWRQTSDRDGPELAERLVRIGREQDEPPVLIFCTDEPMVFVSRHRQVLGAAFRFVVPDAGLVEALADKAQFAELAVEHDLPVPATCVLANGTAEPPEDIDRLVFPIIVKPTARDAGWQRTVGSNAKAVRIASPDGLQRMWPGVRGLSAPAIAQECIDGPETNIVSYHVYRDENGSVAGEFSGRKIRTLPAEYGHTSALTITGEQEVLDLGRDIVERLGLRGVAKLDFKRAADGRLYLLEINARFTLWAHAGARAGVNLPGLVYADLAGRPRPRTARASAGVDWVHPKDVVAARRDGIGLGRWLLWAATRPAKAVWHWTDPLPLAGMAAIRLRDAVRSRTTPPMAPVGTSCASD